MNGQTSQSISDLLIQARKGAPGEVDRLFAAVRNYLHLIARNQVESWLKAKADASDLVQQTMLEAYRDFAQFRGSTEAEWLAWLRRILAHNAAQFARHYRGTEKRQAGPGRPPPPAGAPHHRRFRTQPAHPGQAPTQRLLRRGREVLLAE